MYHFSEAGIRNKDAVLKYLEPTLNLAGKAGRIYYATACSSDGYFLNSFPEITVHPPSNDVSGLSAVREIFQANKNIEIEERPAGIIRVRIGNVPDALLQTTISHINFGHMLWEVHEAIGDIVYSKDGRAAQKKLGIHEDSFAVSIRTGPPANGLPYLPDSLTNVTMDEALDVVAQGFKGIVVYGICTNQPIYSVYFTGGPSQDGYPFALPDSCSAGNLELDRQIAERGDKGAQYCLGRAYAEGKGVKQDYAEAIEWYLKLADQGNAYAENQLGALYEHGNGVNHDYIDALKWYQRAAEQGYSKAQANIGRLYYNGDGVEQDSAEAFKWYLKAADQGDADAQYKIGLMYLKGQGTNRSYEESYFWYSLYAQTGESRKYADAVAAFLKADRIAAVEKRVAEWKPANK
jgi:hypothetical protein